MNCRDAAAILADVEGKAPDVLRDALAHGHSCDARECEARDLIWAEAFLRANRHLVAEYLDPAGFVSDWDTIQDLADSAAPRVLSRLKDLGLLSRGTGDGTGLAGLDAHDTQRSETAGRRASSPETVLGGWCELTNLRGLLSSLGTAVIYGTADTGKAAETPKGNIEVWGVPSEDRLCVDFRVSADVASAMLLADDDILVPEQQWCAGEVIKVPVDKVVANSADKESRWRYREDRGLRWMRRP